MRTDGVNISSEAVELLRDVICHRYGAEYLPASGPRVYKSRAKNAQEAHEAIRPTNPDLAPNQVSGTLTSDQVGRWYICDWDVLCATTDMGLDIFQPLALGFIKSRAKNAQEAQKLSDLQILIHCRIRF